MRFNLKQVIRWSKQCTVVGVAVGALNACGGSGGNGGSSAPPPQNEQSSNAYRCLDGLQESLAGSTVKYWEYAVDGAKYCGTGRGMAVAKDGKGNIFVGGRFDLISGLRASNIAMYSPATGKWSALGSGIETPKFNFGSSTDNPVYGLAVSGNTLYVTGVFDKAGDIATTDIAKWDIESKTWSAMSRCLPSSSTVRIDHERIVVDSIGGIYSSDGCKWSGSSWERIQPAVDRYAPIAIKNDEVYTSVTGRLQKLNTKSGSWTSYTDGEVTSPNDANGGRIAVIEPGLGAEVYVAGRFTKVGEVAAVNVAKWDGSSWSALGDGIDKDEVRTIAVHSSGVYLSTRWDWGGSTGAIYKWDGKQMSRVMLPGMLKDLLAPAAMLPIGDEMWLVGNDGIIVKTPFDQFQPYQK